ncbi:hypothetical protein G6O67_005544 [Ophiocordyceps sinensis]|uniref:Uncharacterized protein n=2 Tax=Ophiocordyceps sinensis TaxID=72228 RepID=A0A8H4V6A3_9HYPO|nr:hypothetical protein OCS_01074 [Ophiocordyceps sinensis CO18]KAF4509271.1 hypothetical protein G6O67_005544 [Ophiocordyceps sinensis]
MAVRVENKVKRPLIGQVVTSPDLRDRRVVTYWLLHLASLGSFAFWIMAATAVSRAPTSLPGETAYTPQGVNSSSIATAATMPVKYGHVGPASLAKRLSVDVWFSLSLVAAVDAIAVVGTFNGALIRSFHYAVSQRMMFLASAVSYAVLQWTKSQGNFVSRYPLGAFVLGLASYWAFSSALDKFEKRGPSSGQASRWGTPQRYSAELGFVDTSWRRALFLTTAVGGVGLLLTMSIAPPWSGLVPILHILFESVFLRAVKAKRTPRYLLLCSPPFFGTICVHWGVAPLMAAPSLSIRPWTFLTLLVVGRLLLDLHLRTTFRPRPELQWARREVLVSTRKLLLVCVAMFLLERMGAGVITYIKPIMVVAIFGLNGAGFLAVAAYNVAFKDPPAVADGKSRGGFA